MVAQLEVSMKTSALFVLCALTLAACDDPGPPNDIPQGIKVMTWNVYVGGNVDEVIASPPDQVPFAAANTFATILATDFATRARAIANQIEHGTPHVVGLQEVSLIRMQSPGDFLVGNPAQAEDVVLDFLAILKEELALRGLDYTVATLIEDTDVELPIATNFPLDDVRLTDYDVVLVRGDVALVNAESANFQAAFTVPGLGFEIIRGWNMVDVVVDEITYRIINTHLEPDVPAVQAAQAAEMLAIAQLGTLPTFIVGDLNSNADGSGTATYQTLLDAGFDDLWQPLNGDPDGFTCCNSHDLTNAAAEFVKRIDFILYNDVGVTPGNGPRTSALTELVGESPFDKVGGLWPSDHAGILSHLIVPPGLGQAIR
jgi:hypothetical protein